METKRLRDYGDGARATVRPLYEENHRRQTLAFVRAKKEEYLGLDHARMSIWDAMALLDELVDDSDPDTELGQTEHLLQTAESLRRARQPEWMIVAGLVHDLGKVLCHFGEPQWAVVGDTFPLGCRFSARVVHADLFDENPDRRVTEYQSVLGIYESQCGLDAVDMSWGHDEYLYHVLKEYLPEEALYVVRYHSFYAAHDKGEYDHLMNDRDRGRMGLLRLFSRHDLYSKTDDPPDTDALRARYSGLIERYFPDELRW